MKTKSYIMTLVKTQYYNTKMETHFWVLLMQFMTVTEQNLYVFFLLHVRESEFWNFGEFSMWNLEF